MSSGDPRVAPQRLNAAGHEQTVGVTEEARKKSRAEYAKTQRQNISDEQKERARELARERQRRWRESHPDQVVEMARKSAERRKQRYNEDPEFRAEYRNSLNEYARNRRKAEGK